MIFGVVFDISSLRAPIRVSAPDVHLEAVEAVLDVVSYRCIYPFVFRII